MPEMLQLAAAGSSSLKLSWSTTQDLSEATFKVEIRPSAWLVNAKWNEQALPPEEVRLATPASSSSSSSSSSVEVTIRDLQPQTHYDVRLHACFPDGSTEASAALKFQTLSPAPSLSTPPKTKCARYDRLLLHWVGPTVQADEVVAYRVKAFEKQGRWPVMFEVEAKLASRLLKPTEQTTQFLSGEVAMRVPPTLATDSTTDSTLGVVSVGSESEYIPHRRRSSVLSSLDEDTACQVASCDDEEAYEVHFWLTSLSPSAVYHVQVAAITGSGQGQWSPLSEPLETWRVAPNLQPPSALLLTHASAAFGLELEPIESGAKVQDEEIEQFEVVMTPEPQKGVNPDSRVVLIPRQSSLELGTRLRELPSDILGRTPEDLALFVAEVSGLTPQTSYICKARAVSHAGQGTWSATAIVKTIAVPPGITELALEEVQHNSASLTWCSSDRAAPPEFISACLGDTAPGELEERCVRGFRLRTADAQQKVWTERLGIRATATAYETRMHRFHLEGLEPSSTTLVQLAAVAKGQGDGEWSDTLEIATESLAPLLEAAPEVESVGRQKATISWRTPAEFDKAPILGYEVHLSPDKPRAGSSRDVCVHLASEGGDDATYRVWIQDDYTFASLGRLEPDTVYTVNVAALTPRGLGKKSLPCKLETLPCAPSMNGEQGPTLIKARHDRLLLRCEGPVPDWGENESSDVIRYCARYFECSRGFGRHGSWKEVDDVEHSDDGDGAFSFWLIGLKAECQYQLQVASVTAAGQGPWSKQSERLNTWRVAPTPSPAQFFFRTHTALVVGWDIDIEAQEGIDEDVQEFVVSASSSTTRDEACTVQISCEQATDLAKDWHLEPSTPSPTTGNAAADIFRWPDAILWPDTGHCPRYVAVLQGLTPGRSYTCSVCCITAGGKGRTSQSSDEVATLAIAPRVEFLAVDEVQSDQMQVSWVLPKMVTPTSMFERFSLSSSLEALELRGYDVRYASHGGWRLNWSEPVYTEVEMLSCGDGERMPRVHFAVTNLQPETLYHIEARARSSSGNGEWCRLGDEPIRTAMVAEAPPAPELVFASHNALNFSFTGVEDERIIAYEVRHYEYSRLGWKQPSNPVRFDMNSLAVRVTGEKRWIVNMDKMNSDTKYSLQLRGITSSGGITKWSLRSEPMQTQVGGGVDDTGIDSIGINYADDVSFMPESSASSSREGEIENLQKQLEKILSFTMTYATKGVRLSAVKVPSVTEQSEELLRDADGDREAAVLAASKIEDDSSWRTRLPDFLIQQVPVVGCSTLLLRESWRTIRRCALIAHLYGHDTNTPETQALILTCLVPMGGGSGGSVQPGSGNVPAATGFDLANSRKVVYMVSRTLAKETFVYATGMKMTGQAAVAALENAATLLKNYSSSDSNPNSTGDRPEDADTPSPVRCALVVFRPQKQEERPLVLLGLVTLWLLPILVSLARVMAEKVLPILAKRMHLEVSMATLAGCLIITQIFGIAGAIWVQQNIDQFVSTPATLVFTVYAILPGLSIYMAMRSIIQSHWEVPFFFLLGLYNLGGGYLRWSRDLQDDAMLEKREPPFEVSGKHIVEKSRDVLWKILVLDFLVEEILGELFQLHSFRLLVPTLGDHSTITLVEYRTLAFALGLISAWAQEKTLALLQRRSVLLRLLGARKAILAGLSLLAMGAFAVVQQAKTFVFLREISPAPMWCGVLLWIRRYGAYLSVALPIANQFLQLLSVLSLDSLVPLSVAVGIVIGCCACSTFNSLWLDKKEHLQADYRVLYLFPHMSSQAREKASRAMRVAFTRGAQATTEAAGEWLAGKALRSILSYGKKRIFPSGASDTSALAIQ